MRLFAIISNVSLATAFSYIAVKYQGDWTPNEYLASLLIYVSTLSSIAVLTGICGASHSLKPVLSRSAGKRFLVVGLSTFLALAAGGFIGREGAPTVKVVQSLTEGGYVPPTETVQAINKELKEKLSQIVGDYRAQHHMAVVSPLVSGYALSMAGPSDSNFWNESIQKPLRSWVCERISQLNSGLNATQNKKSEEIAAPGGP